MKVFDAATEDCARGLCLHAARPRERFVRDSVWLRGREMAVVEWVAPLFKLWWCVCGTAVTVEKRCGMWLRVLGGGWHQPGQSLSITMKLYSSLINPSPRHRGQGAISSRILLAYDAAFSLGC